MTRRARVVTTSTWNGLLPLAVNALPKSFRWSASGLLTATLRASSRPMATNFSRVLRASPASVGRTAPPQPCQLGPEAPQHLLTDHQQVILPIPVLLAPHPERRHELVTGDKRIHSANLDLLGEEHPGRV